MAQTNPAVINSATDTGSTLATWLNSLKNALWTTNSGATQPTGIGTGQMWLDTSGGSTAYVLKMYDGSSDISLFTLDFTNHILVKDHATPVLLDEQTPSGAASVTLTSAIVDEFDDIRVQIVAGTNFDGTFRFDMSDDGGSTWLTNADNGAQNCVYGTTHVKDSPVASGLLDIDAQQGVGGTILGEVLTSYSAKNYVEARVSWTRGPSAVIGGVNHVRCEFAGSQADAFKFTDSGADINGTFRLWGVTRA